ncbi:zinc finger-like domain-containing protein [Marinomonas ostreistagni]|uniref:zinc finger-like domain-containing protein n=1 Tax=Marinomonas ostreistagni TaxID=359209 RepID=UPI0019527770|nr:zinc finger-like domain-containing protein [Marinomonas ostreistagni]MBM6551821.1 hypothetical protein [Marinomonas ostreistagni]
MDSTTFLQPFNALRDKWLPNLGVSLEAIDSPITETNPYSISAEFKIDASIISNLRGGDHGCNCSSKADVEHQAKELADSGCSGKSEVLNNLLQHTLATNSLLTLYNNGSLSLKEYEFSCLITCDTCYGSGRVSCYRCHGKGTQEEAYQAHVRDEVITQNGNVVSRSPVYETRYRTVTCGACGGSGTRQCGTCYGDGVNTYQQYVRFGSAPENRTAHWSSYEKLPWVDTFIKNRQQERLKIHDAADWDYSAQLLQEHERPGCYRVELPGTLSAAQCKVQAKSGFSEPTEGDFLSIGNMPYDTDYVFDPHVRWTDAKRDKIPLTGEALSPLLNNKLVDDCVEDMQSEDVPRGEMPYLNIVRKETVTSLQGLLNELVALNKGQREKISVLKILLYSVLSGVLLAGIIFGYKSLDIASHYLNFGIYPMIANSIEILYTIGYRSLAQFNGYLDIQMWLFFLIAFLPTMLLMKVFGSNKVLTVKRILKWYVFGTLFISAFLMQFTDVNKEYLNVTAHNVLFDFIVLSLLGGILWSRKGSFGRQKHYAKEYNSRRLMELLGYSEQDK